MSINSNVVDYCPAVVAEAVKGLLGQPKTLASWLFYDAEGSLLFEQITALPEYYLSRTERKILTDCAPEVVSLAGKESSDGGGTRGWNSRQDRHLAVGACSASGYCLLQSH